MSSLTQPIPPSVPSVPTEASVIRPSVPRSEASVIRPSVPAEASVPRSEASVPRSEASVPSVPAEASVPRSEASVIRPSVPRSEASVIRPSVPRSEASVIRPSVPRSEASVPSVSICTPTFNRRPFVSMMRKCFEHQTYPNIVEWIIYDDGTDPIEDLVVGDPKVRYIRSETRVPSIGAKRNRLNDEAVGDIIVYMDDDDYYPPERVSHAVETLLSHPEALCCGSSALYVYFSDIGKDGSGKSDNRSGGSLYQFGPYGPMHATAASMAFWRVQLLSQTRFDDAAFVAEEPSFLKNQTIPLVQLDPAKTMVVFPHRHNTVDKRVILSQGGDTIHVIDPTKRTIHDLVKEDEIRRFFLEELDALLLEYPPGDPTQKPENLRYFEEKRMQQFHKMKQHIDDLTLDNTYLKEQVKYLTGKIGMLIGRLKDGVEQKRFP